jgi:hypothetical protein
MSKSFRLGIFLVLSACGGKTLDLGQPFVPRYSTPDTLDAAEADGGTSVPAAIASGQDYITELAIDATRIFWKTYSADHQKADRNEISVVRSCAKANCGATVVTYATYEIPWGLAVNKSNVYWLTSILGDARIVWCPIEHCTGEPKYVERDLVSRQFAVDDTHVYWVSPEATLLKCPAEGCQGAPTVVAGPPNAFAGRLILDDANVYWISRGEAPEATGSIMTVPKDGSAPPRSIVAGLHLPYSLAVDSQFAYWTEFYLSGAVRRCPLTGCTGEPDTLASQQPYARSLAVDGKDVYWVTSSLQGDPYSFVDQGPNDIVQCARETCRSTAIQFLHHRGGVGIVLLDETHAYWSSLGPNREGAVLRMRRRP